MSGLPGARRACRITSRSFPSRRAGRSEAAYRVSPRSAVGAHAAAERALWRSSNLRRNTSRQAQAGGRGGQQASQQHAAHRGRQQAHSARGTGTAATSHSSSRIEAGRAHTQPHTAAGTGSECGSMFSTTHLARVRQHILDDQMLQQSWRVNRSRYRGEHSISAVT